MDSNHTPINTQHHHHEPDHDRDGHHGAHHHHHHHWYHLLSQQALLSGLMAMSWGPLPVDALDLIGHDEPQHHQQEEHDPQLQAHQPKDQARRQSSSH